MEQLELLRLDSVSVGERLLIKNALRFASYVLLVWVLWSAAATAQQPSAPPANLSPAQPQAAGQNRPATPGPRNDGQLPSDKNNPPQNEKKNEKSGTSNDRLFYALPNFLSVESAGKLPPLTTK